MRGVMTETQLGWALKRGYGQGRGESYRSWIRVRRNHHSKVSNLQTMHSPLYKRELHLLSGLEYNSAQVGMWLGPAECREQFPFWPHEHDHPNTGLHPDLDRKYPRVRGLLDIAKDAGIDHGVYVGTNIPFVATMDFTWALGPWGQRRLVNWSCKPADFLRDAENRTRMMERIHMEELYSDEIRATYLTITGEEWPSALDANLDYVIPLHSMFSQKHCHDLAAEFGAHVMEVADERPLHNANMYAAERMKLNGKERGDYFRLASWLGFINIDLSQPIVMSRALRKDTGFKRLLKARLFAEP